MRARLAVLTIGAFSAMGLFASSSASAATFCYDVQVNVQGQSVVSQTGCVPA